MGLTKAGWGPAFFRLPGLLPVLLCCVSAAPLSGQSPVLLGTEIQRLEGLLEKPGTGSAERRDALRRLARLQEISGNMEGAAAFWIRAAAEGERRDDGALLRGGQALAAMGEWEKAGEAVKTLLLSAGDRDILLEARLLGARIEGFRSGNGAALISLLDNRDYEPLKPAIYYTLWKIQGDEAWKNRLLAECPRSPEGRIAAGDTAAVAALPRAMWLLLPGRAGFSGDRRFPVTPGPSAGAAPPVPAAGSAPPPADTGSPAGPASAVPAASVPASSAAAAAPSPAGNAGKPAALLQTGLFSREANAGAMAERLRNAGFSPSVGRRSVNGTGYWAVTVEPGQDMGQTILRLKDAGFESFPVY